MSVKQLNVTASAQQVQKRPNGIFYKAKLLAAGIFIVASSYAFGQKASKEATPDTTLLNKFKIEYKQAMEKRGVTPMSLTFLLTSEMPKEIPDFFTLETPALGRMGVLTKAELETLKEKGNISISGKYIVLNEGTIYVFTKRAQAQPASQE